MGKYLNGLKPNYDKYPVVRMSGTCLRGWEEIMDSLRARVSSGSVFVFECYQGVYDDEILGAIAAAFPGAPVYKSADAMKEEDVLYSILKDDITDDRVFGYITRYTMDVYFDDAKVKRMREAIAEDNSEIRIVYGTGASYICGEPGTGTQDST